MLGAKSGNLCNVALGMSGVPKHVQLDHKLLFLQLTDEEYMDRLDGVAAALR